MNDRRLIGTFKFKSKYRLLGYLLALSGLNSGCSLIFSSNHTKDKNDSGMTDTIDATVAMDAKVAPGCSGTLVDFESLEGD